MKSFAIVSLGCSRNLVDSEVIAGSLKERGLKERDLYKGVDLCVVNTCAFIESARQESVDAIMDLAGLKKSGKVKKLVVCGCLGQLYKGKLSKSLPEADLVLGTSDFPKIADLIERLGPETRPRISAHPDFIYDETSPRSILTPRHYAYVKISEGCSNLCSYCIISRLRGDFRSRSIESVVDEVKKLSEGGFLKEVDIVGQDTTLFGLDRYGRPELPELLKKVCAIDTGVEWVRVLYTHPAHYSDELIDVIRSENRICKYLDLPIQHISDKILKKMNRHTTRSQIADLVHKLRARIPGLVLRTSIIVGFPGETDKDFGSLLDFIRKAKFERLGAFMYCREEGTGASKMGSQVPELIKKERFDELMRVQQQISSDLNRKKIGTTVKVLIDEKEKPHKDRFIGRTYSDAPEVDGVVYVSGKDIRAGQFYDVRITDSLEYDLVGKKTGKAA